MSTSINRTGWASASTVVWDIATIIRHGTVPRLGKIDHPSGADPCNPLRVASLKTDLIHRDATGGDIATSRITAPLHDTGRRELRGTR
jgi:hypothetical protein